MEFILLKHLLTFSIDIYVCLISLTISFFFIVHFFLEYFKTKTFSFVFNNLFYLFFITFLVVIAVALNYSAEIFIIFKNFFCQILNFLNIFSYSAENLDNFICVLNDYNILIFKNV